MMSEKADSFTLRKGTDLTDLCIEGDRVRLLSIREEHAPAIFEEFTEEITHYMIPKPPERIEETLEFIHTSIEGMKRQDDLAFAIVRVEGDEILGCCGLHGRENPRKPELGIWLKKGAHGKRLGREAIRVLCLWALDTIDFDYLVYPVDRNNIPSRKIPESLAGVLFEEKVVPTMRGTELDEVIYKLTPEHIAALL